MRILTICPSIRPSNLITMMDSFLITRSHNTEIIINREEKSITKIFNDTFNANPDQDYYHMVNDDSVYKTPLWDMTLAVKGKISYGNDLFQGKNLCTFPMIDGDIVRAVGWLQMPLLEKYFGDTVWFLLGYELGILNYNPEVVIEHKWDGKQDMEIYQKDHVAFSTWAMRDRFTDLEKIRKTLNDH